MWIDALWIEIYTADYIYLILLLHDYFQIYWFVSNSFYMLNRVFHSIKIIYKKWIHRAGWCPVHLALVLGGCCRSPHSNINRFVHFFSWCAKYMQIEVIHKLCFGHYIKNYNDVTGYCLCKTHIQDSCRRVFRDT